jgi:hypothetical protein
LPVTLGNRERVSGTNLEMVNRRRTQRISPQSILNYETFVDETGSLNSRSIKTFEKFIVSGLLLREGYETYLNPVIGSGNRTPTFEADACGVKGDHLLVAFCPSEMPSEDEWHAIRQISQSRNAQALILSPREIDRKTLEHEAGGTVEAGKLRLELLGWFEDNLEVALQDTLHMIELLVNETRMRMMAPLLHKSALKKDLRARINPKLVYHNLTALSEAGLLDEPIEGTYELSQLGTTVLAEFIAFLERTRKTLYDHRHEEVKSIGRR